MTSPALPDDRWPPLGRQLPQRGNRFSRWLGRTVLRLMGWRLANHPPDLRKMVLIGAPHTSNMDGVVGMAVLVALGLKARTMIKDSAFKGPLGMLLRWLGAIPVRRSSPKGVIEQSVEAFAENDQLVLLIAPEGTRHGAPEWKRGFYRIATDAAVSVVPAAADYGHKVVRFGPPLQPRGNYKADLATLVAFYAEHGRARHPSRLSGPLREAAGSLPPAP